MLSTFFDTTRWIIHADEGEFAILLDDSVAGARICALLKDKLDPQAAGGCSSGVRLCNLGG